MNRTLFFAALSGTLVLSLGSAPVLAEETETNASAEPASVESSASLSDDIYSFQLELNGNLLSFPMPYDEFISAGYTLKDDPSTELQPNSYTWVTASEGDLSFTVYAMNLGVNTLPLSECDICGIDIDHFNTDKAPDTTITLPAGISYGVSTLDEIETAYGPASDVYEGELYTKLTYEYDFYQEVELEVDVESGVLNAVSMRNMDKNKSTTANAEVVVSDKVPDSVLSYKAPEELGDDLLSYTVEYAGDLYQLPAPVSVFIENGWRIKDGTEDVIAGKSSGWVYMMKDNQEYHALARNYEPDAASYENCFLTSVESNIHQANLPMTLPKGITMGMSKEDLEAALEGTSYETDDSSDLFIYYEIEDPDYALDGIEIMLKKDTNEVMGIEVKHAPKSL